MHTKTMRWHWLIACMVALLLTAGCFQSDGTSLQPTPFGQSQPTFTVPPSLTPEPLPTYTFFPTPDGSAFGAENETTTDNTDFTNPDLGVQETLPDTTIDIAQGPTNPPTILDPDQIRATEIIAGATATVDAANTATAQALFGFPTATLAIVDNTGGIGPTAAFPVATNLPGADCIHEVRAGENLFRIALTYGLTIQDVAGASGIVNPELILVGQRLTIPGCGNTGARPLPTSTPNPVDAAVDTSATTGNTTTTGSTITIPASEITSGAYFPNGTPVGGVLGGATASTTTTTTTTGSGQVHTVQQGETLYEISIQYGVTVADLAAANGLTDINTIFINQQLVIP